MPPSLAGDPTAPRVLLVLITWFIIMVSRSWFRGELSGYLRERLTDVATRRRQPWSRAFLERLAEDHVNRRRNYVHEIDAVLTLDAVDRLILQQSSPCPRR
jgi:hypothetical protein